MADYLNVAAVMERWGPRFISNGVPLADYQAVSKAISSMDDWGPAWVARAETHEAMGMAALEAGNSISAGGHLQTAGVVYHFAKFIMVGDLDRMRSIHEKAVRCRDLALAHIDPPGIRVEIPYAGSKLYGILRKPAGAARGLFQRLHFLEVHGHIACYDKLGDALAAVDGERPRAVVDEDDLALAPIVRVDGAG